MSLSAYLAKNYLTADGPASDPTRPKKKRKKNPGAESTTGVIIADDDDLSLSNTSIALRNDDDLDAPSMYAPDLRQGRSAEFRKKKQNGWKTISDAEANSPQQSATNGTPAAGAEEADSIIQAAVLEQESRRLADEEGDAPTFADDLRDDDKRPRMAGGGRGGLQTAAETRALEAARQAQDDLESGKLKKKKTKEEREAQQEETVYRDATGRRIDVHMKRAEARKAEEEERRKELEEKKKSGGDVQMKQREDRKQQLDDAKFLSIARYADDEDLNQELKGRERWGDTMAAYIEKETGGGGKGATPVIGGGSTKPMYTGAFQPNRYGIRPGHRWDGVDRGNGFEKEWFQARSRKDRNRDLDYQWQMDE